MVVNQKLANIGQHHKTVNDLLQWRANLNPDKSAFTFLSNGQAIGSITYGELYNKARNVSTALSSFVSVGERVVLFYPPGIDFVVALFGCLLSGGIAVPLPYPDLDRIEEILPLLDGVLEDSQPSLILTNNRLFAYANRIFLNSRNLESLQWFSTDRDFDYPITRVGSPIKQESDPAVLLYNFDEKGSRLGIMLSQRNIMFNVFTLSNLFDVLEGDTSLSWLSSSDSMGLFLGMVFPVYFGIHGYLMSPIEVSVNPTSWLKAISKYRCSISSGYGKVYEKCAALGRDASFPEFDLSRWNVALADNDSLSSNIIERFVNTFKIYGFEKSSFVPLYIKPEATMFIGGCPISQVGSTVDISLEEIRHKKVNLLIESSNTISLVGCQVDKQLENIIVSSLENFEIVNDDMIGEVWISGDNVFSGYWNKVTSPSDIFQEINLGNGTKKYFKTGDLGFKHAEFLYRVGRVENLCKLENGIFIPELLEGLVNKNIQNLIPANTFILVDSSQIDPGLIFFIEVYQNLKLSKSIEMELRTLITQLTDRSYGLDVCELVIVENGEIPKSYNGKVLREDCLRRYKESNLKLMKSEHSKN